MPYPLLFPGATSSRREVNMALEMLKGYSNIDGFDVRHSDDSGWFIPRDPDAVDKEKYVEIDHLRNIISFRIQKGAIRDCGENGCQVDTLVLAVKLLLEGLNGVLPCASNEVAILALEHAYDALKRRKQDREAREVEGTLEP